MTLDKGNPEKGFPGSLPLHKFQPEPDYFHPTRMDNLNP
jgi:hypothetical protein